MALAFRCPRTPFRESFAFPCPFPQRYNPVEFKFACPPCGDIHDIAGPRESQSPTVRCLTLPSQRSRDLNGAPRVASTLAVTKTMHHQRYCRLQVLFSRFHSQVPRTQASQARRHGGLLLRRSAPTGSCSSHFAGPLQESRPWHLGAASRSRPPGGVP